MIEDLTKKYREIRTTLNSPKWEKMTRILRYAFAGVGYLTGGLILNDQAQDMQGELQKNQAQAQVLSGSIDRTGDLKKAAETTNYWQRVMNGQSPEAAAQDAVKRHAQDPEQEIQQASLVAELQQWLENQSFNNIGLQNLQGAVKTITKDRSIKETVEKADGTISYDQLMKQLENLDSAITALLDQVNSTQMLIRAGIIKIDDADFSSAQHLENLANAKNLLPQKQQTLADEIAKTKKMMNQLEQQLAAKKAKLDSLIQAGQSDLNIKNLVVLAADIAALLSLLASFGYSCLVAYNITNKTNRGQALEGDEDQEKAKRRLPNDLDDVDSRPEEQELQTPQKRTMHR